MVDVVVVGGGVIGLAIAWEAARGGMKVTLLERGETGHEATGASAGMLAAQLEAHEPGPLLTLSLRSRALYPGFLRDLEADSGMSVDLRREGALVAALDDAGWETLARTAEAQRRMGLDVETLTAQEIREREPAIAERATGGMLLPHEHTVDPRLLAAALRRAAEQSGADIRPGSDVTGLVAEAGCVRGVRVPGSPDVAAREVVVAAGAWAGSLGAPG